MNLLMNLPGEPAASRGELFVMNRTTPHVREMWSLCGGGPAIDRDRRAAILV